MELFGDINSTLCSSSSRFSQCHVWEVSARDRKGHTPFVQIRVWVCMSITTFLSISHLLPSTSSRGSLQRQPTEGLHHRVGLADLYLQVVGVVTISCMKVRGQGFRHIEGTYSWTNVLGLTCSPVYFIASGTYFRNVFQLRGLLLDDC